MTICQISDELFWGFNIDINLTLFETNENIIIYIKNRLKNYFLAANLQLLAEKVDEKNLHIDENFENLNNYKIIYICSHKH